MKGESRFAIVTGASSGIGAAIARALSALGVRCALAGRRRDRLDALAEQTGGIAMTLDVTEAESVRTCVRQIGAATSHVDILVNNAGLALRLDAIEDARDVDWATMWETNVLGVVRMCRELMPLMRAAELAHILNISSASATEVYEKGAGYVTTKHAVHVITQTLRRELNGEAVRITEIAPGIVDTELPLVRFGESADVQVLYAGFDPLHPEDVAACVTFAVTQPTHVNIDQIVVRPLAQATATQIARERAGNSEQR